MWVVIKCSNCGKTMRLSSNKLDCVNKPIQAGWGSCGSALYCPKCTKTWHERNEKPMAEERNTVRQIAKAVADALIGRKEDA